MTDTDIETHLGMHHDHEHWLSDHSMWRDDVALWREEAQKAADDLAAIGAALRRLSASIDQHEENLEREVDRIKLHEHALSEFERTGLGGDIQLLTLAKKHKEEAAEHLGSLKAHEQLKREHHTLMAHWNTLLRELTRPAR